VSDDFKARLFALGMVVGVPLVIWGVQNLYLLARGFARGPGLRGVRGSELIAFNGACSPVRDPASTNRGRGRHQAGCRSGRTKTFTLSAGERPLFAGPDLAALIWDPQDSSSALLQTDGSPLVLE
jgi:hypothetical protein